MKYCTKCGKELLDDAVFCTACGCATGDGPVQVTKNDTNSNSGMQTAAKVFMIISTVIMGIYLIPLAWCLPMTISYCKKIKNNQPVSVGFKVCSLIFVSLLGGIFMLCDNSDQAV